MTMPFLGSTGTAAGEGVVGSVGESFFAFAGGCAAAVPCAGNAGGTLANVCATGAAGRVCADVAGLGAGAGAGACAAVWVCTADARLNVGECAGGAGLGAGAGAAVYAWGSTPGAGFRARTFAGEVLGEGVRVAGVGCVVTLFMFIKFGRLSVELRISSSSVRSITGCTS